MKCIDSALAEKRTQMPKRLKDVLFEVRRDRMNEGVDMHQTLVGHLTHADVGLVCTVRKLRNRSLRVGDAVEHRCLTRVRQSDDSTFQTHSNQI